MREYRDIKDIAKDVRQNLKETFPDCKFSVSIERFSGGQAMDVVLLEAPFEVFRRDCEYRLTGDGYLQVNHYWIDENNVLTMMAKAVLKKVVKIANLWNWDNSDSQTDYFDVNYWLQLSIGRWNRPFKNTQEATV